MKNALKIASFVLIVGAAVPAQAQDAPSYTGPRAEARFSYDFVGAGFRNTTDFQGRGTFGDDSSDEGTNLGVEVGYDLAAGPLIVGVYAGGEFGDTQIAAIDRPYNLETGRNYTIGGRVGVLSRGVLVYAKGGYSNGRLKPILLTGGNDALFNNFDRNRTGFHVGAGAEFNLTGGVYGKVEGLHHRYDRATISTSEEVRFSRSQLVGGVGFRF